MEGDEALAITGPGLSSQNKGGGGQFTLEFVTTVSVNIDSKAEKRKNQKIIRQTVMKNFRQQQKAERMQSKGTNKVAAASGVKMEVETYEPSSSSFQTNVRSPSTTFSESNSSHELHHNELKRSTSHNSQSSFALSSPVTPLGAGRVDPFISSYAGSTCHMHELIDHSTTVLWPSFRPQGASDLLPNIPAAWLLASNSSPVTMHSMLYGAQVHLDVLRGPAMKINNPIRLYHKVQTMRLLKEELEHPDKIRLDGAVLAILALSANEIETVVNNVKERVRSPFHSPLKSVQWLDVYGSITHIKTHVQAMRTLIDQRGGLEQLQLEGLAEIVSFSDILGATQSLSNPHWPLLDRTLKFSPLEVNESVRHPLTILASQFSPLVPLGITPSLSCILHGLADVTILIDCHTRGTIPIRDFTSFIDRRNSVQHRLMSLPSSMDLIDEAVKSPVLYEAVRLTAILYSGAVTFPLPALSGQFQRLAQILQTQLESSKFDPCWQHCPETLLWMLVLGGIAASGMVTGERAWFVRNTAIIASVLEISRWEEVSEMLEGFLWLDSACEAGGQVLWAEVTGKGSDCGDIP